MSSAYLLPSVEKPTMDDSARDQAETEDEKKERLAKAHLSADFSLALATSKFAVGSDWSELAIEYFKKIERTKSGDMSEMEGMLAGQAILLNKIFSDMAMRAGQNADKYPNATKAYMNIALRTQAQCTRTIEVLCNLKKPKSPEQKNIANQQIVNNGTMNIKKPSNELDKPTENKQIGEVIHAKVDTRSATSPTPASQENKAVVEINRGEDLRG